MSDYASWVGLELTTTFSASSLRNIVTSIYIVFNFLIALVGEDLIVRHGQRQLLSNKALRITNLSPFLSITSTLKYLWDVRRLPGGWFGTLMIASGAFGLSGHFLVNSYIVAEQVNTSCDFHSGIVTLARTNNSAGNFTPSAAWSPTALVRRAQQAVVNNDYDSVEECHDGIWSKININVTTLCPTREDKIGYWNCTLESPSIITPQDRLNTTTVQLFANASTFLYNPTQESIGRIGDDGGYSDMMAWSSNSTGASLLDLSFRIMMVSGLNATQNFSTSNYQCGLQVTNTSWSPSKLDVPYVLDAWADTMLGALLDIDTIYYRYEVQSILNAITMVAGSANTIWNKEAAVVYGAGTTYGCNDYRTVARPQVFVILLVLILIFLVVFLMDMTEILLNKKNKFQPVVGSLPVTLLDWQLALGKKMVNDDLISKRDLGKSEYKWNQDTYAIECSSKRGVQKYEPVSNASGEVVVNEAKVASGTNAGVEYVWNSDSKTIEQRGGAAHDGSNSSSDLSFSKEAIRTTTVPL